MTKDKISIITANYNGLKYLEPLFDSLKNQTYKNLEMILVDNNSSDDSIAFVEKKYPEVKIVKNKKNLGFAGGNNSALPYCDGEYVALINNDMVADPHWLDEMHSALIREKADVVGAKILFYKPFVSLRIETNVFNPQKSNLGEDTRNLGCKISSDLAFDDVSYNKTLFCENTFNEETENSVKYHWVGNNAVVKIPIDLSLEKFVLKFKAAKSQYQLKEKVSIFIGNEKVFEDFVAEKFTEFAVEIDKNLVLNSVKHVINNAGSVFDVKTGRGRDIGMNEDDDGQYDKPKEAFSLCGGSMLIKKELIDAYDLFDDYFFAYYEDTDFCWRIKNKKKKMFFEPRAIVYHIHTGTSKEWSPLFRYYVARNRLAMMLKNGTCGDAAREWLFFFAKTIFDALLMIKNKRRESRKIIWINFRVIGDLFIHLPALIYKRIKNMTS